MAVNRNYREEKCGAGGEYFKQLLLKLRSTIDRRYFAETSVAPANVSGKTAS